MILFRHLWPALLAVAQPAMAQDGEAPTPPVQESCMSLIRGWPITVEDSIAAERCQLARRPPATGEYAEDLDALSVLQSELTVVALRHRYWSEITVGVRATRNGVWLQGQNAFMVSAGSERRRQVWASVTKQIVATMVMQQVEANRLALDAFVTSYLILPAAGDQRPPTIRQLLQHQSGLRNPEGDSNDTSFYTADMSDEERNNWCLGERGEVLADRWEYNNCDYIVLGAVLEAVSGQDFEELFAQRIAGPSRMEGAQLWRSDDVMDWPGAGEPPEPDGLAGYGTSAALVGRSADLGRFSSALLDGRLLGEEALAEMWEGDPALGFMALGQWSYSAPLSGCVEPVRIVERRGGIGRYHTLNIILPDLERFLVLTNDTEGTDFGTIWAGEGLAFEMVSVLACGASG